MLARCRRNEQNLQSLLKCGKVSPMCWPCLYAEYATTIWAALRMEELQTLCIGLQSDRHRIVPSSKDPLARNTCQGQQHLTFLGSVEIVGPDCHKEFGKIEHAVMRISGSPKHSALIQRLCSGHLHLSHKRT